jgi:hypothetical protein
MRNMQCQLGNLGTISASALKTQGNQDRKPVSRLPVAGHTGFVESFRAGPEWKCSSFLVLLESCLKTFMTYTIVECTVNKLLMMDRRTVRNM